MLAVPLFFYGEVTPFKTQPMTYQLFVTRDDLEATHRLHAEEGEKDGHNVKTSHAHKLIVVDFVHRCIISVASARALLRDKINTWRTNSFLLSVFFRGDSWRGCCLATVTGSKLPLCLFSVPYLVVGEVQSSVKATDAHIQCNSISRYDIMDE